MYKEIPLFDGPGEVRGLLRTLDYHACGLAHPQDWPAALVTVTELMLDSTIPVRLCVGPELTLLYNDAYVQFLGSRHPAALGQPYYAVWPEIEERTRPLIEQVLAGESVFVDDLELTLIRDGKPEPAWFSYAFAPVRNERREVLGAYGACIENTRQRLLEAHLAGQSARLERMFQQAPGFMAVMRGPEHVYELVNDSLRKLMGERDYVGLPVRVAVPELAAQGFYDLLDKVYSSGEPFIGRGIPADLVTTPGAAPVRRYMNFVYQPITEADGTISGIFVEGNDVTDEFLAQGALERANHSLQDKLGSLERAEKRLAFQVTLSDLLHGLSDPYDMLAKATALIGRQVAASRVVCGDYQKPAQDLYFHSNYVSPGVPELIGMRDVRELAWAQQTSLDRGQTIVIDAMPGAGPAAVRAAITVPLQRDGQLFGALFVQQDAPRRWLPEEVALVEDAASRLWAEVERARAELALRQGDRRKDEFLAMLAHELRNPLAPISAAASVIGMQHLDAAGLQRASQIITRQVRHMTGLVDDLLDVSRVTQGLVAIELTPQDTKAIVLAAVEQVRPMIETRNHSLSLKLPGQPPLVKGDEKRLVQIVANILNNAAKYTPDGGNIELALTAGDGLVQISVGDNGIGIAKEMQGHIFDLFAQAERSADRSQGGLGLGLSLVKSMVELHHGAVRCDSPGTGGGSRFTITLPQLVDAAENAGPALAEGRGENTAGLKVLVVDDNADAADMLHLVIETLGHTVWSEYSSQRALVAAQKHRPQVCLLDIGLPEMDGYALARRLRSQPETAGALLVAVTGYGQEEDRADAYAAGFDHHFVKPLDAERLKELLSQVAARANPA